MGQYLLTLFELFSFYFHHLSLFYGLPDEIKSPEIRDEKKRQRLKSFSISAPKKLVDCYNEDFARLKSLIRDLNTVGLCSFRTRMICIFAIRFTAIYAAYMGVELSYIFAISCLQFVVAPYSFFVGFTWFTALMSPMHLSHFVTNLSLSILLNKLPLGDWMKLFMIPIDKNFILVFFIVDQLLCLICCFYTPGHKTIRYGLSKSLVHVVYGNVNCKTFYLLMWLVLLRRNFHINGLIWLIDLTLGLTPKLSVLVGRYLLHWSPLFYHMHRMGHMPEVYEHAHKFHHFLQGSNAFDGHIFGSGLPEEWLGLMVEIGCALSLGLTPMSLNSHSLWISWINKIDHSQGEGKDNHHFDHHILHSKNFSTFGATLDMVFGTNSDNDLMDLDGYRMERSETDDQITITYTLLD